MSFGDMVADHGQQPRQVPPSANDVHRALKDGHLTAPCSGSAGSPADAARLETADEPAVTGMKTLNQGYQPVLQDWQPL